MDQRIIRILVGLAFLAAVCASIRAADPSTQLFEPYVNVASGPAANSVSLGDLNHDGALDLVVFSMAPDQVLPIPPGTAVAAIYVHLGDGRGGFGAALTHYTGGRSLFIGARPVLADFDGDRNLDVAAIDDSWGGYELVVFRGDGSGGFSARQSLGSLPDGVTASQATAAGDVTGDGLPDLVVGLRGNYATVGVWPNDGKGGFGTPIYLKEFDGPFGLASGPVLVEDVTGDGTADIALGVAVGQIRILVGGIRSSATRTTLATSNPNNNGYGLSAYALAAADLNHDSRPDILASYAYTGLDTFVATATGFAAPVLRNFSSETVFGSSNGNSPDLAVADINRDGNLDVAVVNDNFWMNVSVLLGDGFGSFSAPIGAHVGNAPNYVAAADLNGDERIDLAVSHSGRANNGVDLLLGAAPENRPPDVRDDTASGDEDTALTIEPLSNDRDPDGDSLTISTIGSPQHGSATIISDTAIRYAPAADYSGADSFTYTVSDGHGHTASATIEVTVNAVPDAPALSDDRARTDEDVALAIPVDQLLANDVDPDGDRLTVVSVGDIADWQGTVSLNASDHTVVFTPAANVNGRFTFSYTVNDGTGRTATAFVHVDVAPIDDPPMARPDVFDLREDDSATTLSVLGNDSDPDLAMATTVVDVGERLAIDSVTSPSRGRVEIIDGLDLRYTPNPDANGVDSLTYTIRDHTGLTATTTVTVDIAAVNDAPVAVDDVREIREDTSITLDLLANDRDVDGDTLTLVDVHAFEGRVAINADGTVTYTPSPNQEGTETFTYVVADRELRTTGHATINIAAVNDPPTISTSLSSIETAEDFPVTFANPFVFADVEALQRPGTYTVTFAVRRGTLSLAGGLPNLWTIVSGGGTNTLVLTGPPNLDDLQAVSLVYAPLVDDNGEVALSATVDDGGSFGEGGPLSVTASIPIHIEARNDAPLVTDDAATTPEDTRVAIDVLANDRDVEGNAMTAWFPDAPQHGRIVAGFSGPDGRTTGVVYEPEPNFYGTDQFSYYAEDAAGARSRTAVVRITVTPVNDGPVVVPITDQMNREGDVIAIPVLATDIDGDPLTYSAIGLPPGLTIDPATGIISGTIATPGAGYYSVVIAVADPAGAIWRTPFKWTVVMNLPPPAPNASPVANADIVSTPANIRVAVNAVANDTDPDGDVLTWPDLETRPQHGTILGSSATGFVYRPDTGYIGADRFTYRIDDHHFALDRADYRFDPTAADQLPDSAVWTRVGNLTPVPIDGVGLGIADPGSDDAALYVHRTPFLSGNFADRNFYNTAVLRATVRISPVVDNSPQWDANAIGWSLAIDDGGRRLEITLARDPTTQARVIRLEDAVNVDPIPFPWDNGFYNTLEIRRRSDGNFIVSAFNADPESTFPVQTRVVSSPALGASGGAPFFMWGARGTGGGASFWTSVHAEVDTAPSASAVGVATIDVVNPNHAPVCQAAAPSIRTIWPPDHRQVPIVINGITDEDGDAVRLTITGIQQDEPTNTAGDGNTPIDGGGIGTSSAWVRAERDGRADGRIYVISFTADDGRGGSCNGSVSVSVPHDQRGTAAVDSGVRFDATRSSGK